MEQEKCKQEVWRVSSSNELIMKLLTIMTILTAIVGIVSFFWKEGLVIFFFCLILTGIEFLYCKNKHCFPWNIKNNNDG